MMQAKEDASELKQQTVALKDHLAQTEAEAKSAAEERDRAIAPIGNLVHDSVPIDDNEVCWISVCATICTISCSLKARPVLNAVSAHELMNFTSRTP